MQVQIQIQKEKRQESTKKWWDSLIERWCEKNGVSIERAREIFKDV